MGFGSWNSDLPRRSTQVPRAILGCSANWSVNVLGWHERCAVLPTNSLDGCARRHQAGRQAAARLHPLPHHEKAAEPRKRQAARAESSARRRQEALHAALPVAREAHDSCGRRHIDRLDALANARRAPFEDIDDRIGDALLFDCVARRIIAL